MALINCKDCNSEISDSAESCPKCGAPVPKTIGADEEQCPHCMTVVHKDATKCPGCRAVKGYLYERRYGVFGKYSSILWGIIVPAITIIGLPISAYAAYRVFVTGPRWFVSAHGD